LNIALPFGGVIYLILIRILTKRMRVEVPFCKAHQNHWIKRVAILLPAFLVCFPGAMAAISYGLKPELEAGWLIAVGLGLLVGFVVLCILVRSKTIRPILITDDAITIARVHPAFIAALEEEREQDREEEERDRERRSREREARRGQSMSELRPPPLPRRSRDDRDDREAPRRRSRSDDDYDRRSRGR
jgi:hypothetical protein